jgi:hypothetical protein
MNDALKAQWQRRPAMKKISTVQAFRNEIFKEQKLTIGLDLGDRWSFYCVLDEAGQIFLEQKVATTPEAMKQTFYVRCRFTREDGVPFEMKFEERAASV